MISIIVPVYNCQDFLDQCLQSIVGQTHTDLEVLLVNDGSVDASGVICDRYAELDPRIRVLHKANGGVSSARNLALETAQGEYILFVDADDYIEADFVASLAAAVAGHDVVACAYDRVRDDASQVFRLADSGELPMKTLFEHTLCTQLVGGGCCNKIFRAAIIQDLGLRFDTRIAVGEDMLFLVRYYQRCHGAAYVSDVLYHYRHNQESATEAGFVARRVDRRAASVLQALEDMEGHIDSKNEWQRRFVGYRKARSSLRLFYQMVLSGSSDQLLMARLQDIMRGNLIVYVGSPHARKLEKLVAMAMAMSTRMSYRLAVAMVGLAGRRLSGYRS